MVGLLQHIHSLEYVPELPGDGFGLAGSVPFWHLLSNLHHAVQVRSLAVDATGQWLASGSDDGWVRVWEVRSGRSMRAWNLGAKVRCVAWCPAPGLPILGAAAGNRIVLLPAGAIMFLVGASSC